MIVRRFGWLDWLAVILCVWFVFFPEPYVILFTVILLLPVLGIVLSGFRKPGISSLITLEDENEDKSDVETAGFIVFPSLSLMLRLLLDFQVENHFDLIIMGLVFLFVLLLVIGFIYRDFEKKYRDNFAVYFFLIANLAIYSYAVVFGINCVYDHSDTEKYRSVVIEKSIYKGKGKSYYLIVEPWSENSENNKIKVAKRQFESTRIGDTVQVERRKGLLRVPWHYINLDGS